jgi:hypothetical protein
MIRRYVFSQGAGAPASVPNPVLKIGVSVAPSLVQFYAFLTSPVDADINISQAFADNFISCGGLSQGSIQRNTNYYILTGNTTGTTSMNYNILTGVFNTNHVIVYNVIVNGIAINNLGSPQNITVGTKTVTVMLQQCS